MPAKSTTLAWKAYQIYSDGTLVSWDIDPATMKNVSHEQQDAMADKENKGAYSTTTVINDLTGAQPQNTPMVNNNSTKSTLPLWFSIIAIALSAVALSISLRKKK